MVFVSEYMIGLRVFGAYGLAISSAFALRIAAYRIEYVLSCGTVAFVYPIGIIAESYSASVGIGYGAGIEISVGIEVLIAILCSHDPLRTANEVLYFTIEADAPSIEEAKRIIEVQAVLLTASASLLYDLASANRSVIPEVEDLLIEHNVVI
jgi:hypothetical protein